MLSSEGVESMPRTVLQPKALCFLGLFLAALSGGCVSRAAHEKVVNYAEQANRNLEELRKHCLSLEEENGRLKSRARELESQAVDADWLKNEKERLRRLLGDLDSQGRPSGMPGVEVISTPEGIGFKIEGEVLFAKGKAELTAQGKSTLDKLVPVLRDDKEQRMIRVDGHTDSDPILRSNWGTNLRLSAERSLAVATYLMGNTAGIAERRVLMSGHGPNHPRRSESTEDAKAENRRVEIFLLNKG
jgi:chemotaxis protein MotB